MKMFHITTYSHEILRDHFFMETMLDQWEHHEYRPDIVGTGDFGTDVWRRAIIYRAECLLRSVEDNPEGLICWSDVDIQWFRPARVEMCDLMGENDFLCQREHHGGPDVNTGLMLIRCNERVLNYYRWMVTTMKMEDYRRHDQAMLNDEIRSPAPRVKVAQLPRTYFHWGLGPLPHEIVCHHAINTVPDLNKSSVWKKVDQMLNLRKQVMQRAGWKSFFLPTYMQ